MILNDASRDLAIFTIVQDEPEFIHPWVNHYRRHVADPRDLYVLVHAPTRPDGEPMGALEIPGWQRAEALLTAHHGIHLLPVHHAASFDHRWLRDTVSDFQSFLLQSYDWVLFAEVDEFVLPTPSASLERASLLDYVRMLGADAPAAIRANGFEVVEQDGELPAAPDRYATGANVDLTVGELMAGRQWWRPSTMYSKTLLARAPLRWAVGFHTVEGSDEEISPDQPQDGLTLVHLHKVDFGLALSRLNRFRSRKWSQFDVDNKWGWQNRVDGAAELRKFWELDVDTNEPAEPSRLTVIPDGIRQALG